MKCDRERLSHYLDGELSPEEVRRLHEHLTSCEDCTQDLATFRRLHGDLGRLEDERAPIELQRAVYEQIDERRAKARWGWPGSLLSPVVPLTAAFLLMGGVVAVWRLLPAGTAPVMTAAFTVQETPESLMGMRVELVFDRPVAPESLAQAITIEPYLPMVQRVHENKVELIPQGPVPIGTNYRVVVSNVRDQRGNTQSEPVVLNLTTAPTASLIQESAPVGPRPLVELAGQSSVTAKPGAGQAAAQLASSPALRNRLGAASGAEKSVQLSEQAFQGGAMLHRPDTNKVYALIRETGRWTSFANTWQRGEVLAPAGGTRPPGTLEPMRWFGKIWREQPSVKLPLGWAVYEERFAGGSVQAFQNGQLIRSSYGVAYALFDDGTWLTLPDPKR